MDKRSQSLPCNHRTPNARLRKSYAVINNYIKQSIEHGSAIYLYDFKFPDLSLIAYNHLRTHLDGYTVRPKFYVINFDDPHHSLTAATRWRRSC